MQAGYVGGRDCALASGLRQGPEEEEEEGEGGECHCRALQKMKRRLVAIGSLLRGRPAL